MELIRERLKQRVELQSLNCLAWAARASSVEAGKLKVTSVKLPEGEMELLEALATCLSAPGQRVSASGIIRAATRLFVDAATLLLIDRSDVKGS